MNDNIFEKARKVGIEEILQRLGARRAGGRGFRLLYHCPFREDRNPSMYVNTDKGTWVDMANPDEYKGDGIKLVELTLNLRPLEAAKYIVGEGAISSNARPQSYTPRRVQRVDSIEYTVHELEHPALLDYLNSRGIPANLAKRLCKEIHIGRLFFIGFASQNGGYELRNKLGKRSLGNKNISVLGTGDKAIIFEGFIDYLSHLRIYGFLEDHKYIVLNSVCNLQKVIDYFNVFGLPQHIQLWLDNDDAGRNAAIFLTEKLQCSIEDMSSVYASYNDVNDWLVATR
jgi:DNA primase